MLEAAPTKTETSPGEKEEVKTFEQSGSNKDISIVYCIDVSGSMRTTASR